MKEREKRSVIWQINRDKLEQIIKNSKTFKDVLDYFGFSNKGGNAKTLKQRLVKDNIDFSHISLGYKHNIGKKFPDKAKPLVEYLIEKSTYGRNHLKKRLLKEGLLENKCSLCNLKPEWNNEPLVMVLDHINGTSDDNRIENLRLLCPNCNSQQITFAGRSLKKIYNCPKCGKKINKNSKTCSTCFNNYHKKIQNRPSKEDLLKMVWEQPTTNVAKKFNVSDKAVEKWCKGYNIPKPARGYWTKQKYSIAL